MGETPLRDPTITNNQMNKKIDLFLTIATISFLCFVLISELANLIGFGTQEFYLNHPEYPEGEKFGSAIEKGRLELTFWTILTIVFLATIIYAKVNRDQKLFYRTTLAAFIATIYIPLIAFAKGKITTGFFILAVIVMFIAVVIVQIMSEKAKSITSTEDNGE